MMHEKLLSWIKDPAKLARLIDAVVRAEGIAACDQMLCVLQDSEMHRRSLIVRHVLAELAKGDQAKAGGTITERDMSRLITRLEEIQSLASSKR